MYGRLARTAQLQTVHHLAAGLENVISAVQCFRLAVNGGAILILVQHRYRGRHIGLFIGEYNRIWRRHAAFHVYGYLACAAQLQAVHQLAGGRDHIIPC